MKVKVVFFLRLLLPKTVFDVCCVHARGVSAEHSCDGKRHPTQDRRLLGTIQQHAVRDVKDTAILHHQSRPEFVIVLRHKHKQQLQASRSTNQPEINIVNTNNTMAKKGYKLTSASGDGPKTCAFFFSDKGCRNGANCKFSHDADAAAAAAAAAPSGGASDASSSVVSSETESDGEIIEKQAGAYASLKARLHLGPQH